MRFQTSAHGQRGAVMVEFAITLLLMLTVIFGIIEFSKALYQYNTIANAARMGSRWMAIRGVKGVACNGGCPITTGSSTDPACTDANLSTCSSVVAYVKSQLTLIDTTDTTLAVNAYWSSTVNDTSNSCSSTGAEGCYATVVVSYPFTADGLSFLNIHPTLYSISSVLVGNGP
jgi:Flp pilus assembly protein TadG